MALASSRPAAAFVAGTHPSLFHLLTFTLSSSSFGQPLSGMPTAARRGCGRPARETEMQGAGTCEMKGKVGKVGSNLPCFPQHCMQVAHRATEKQPQFSCLPSVCLEAALTSIRTMKPLMGVGMDSGSSPNRVSTAARSNLSILWGRRSSRAYGAVQGCLSLSRWMRRLRGNAVSAE